METPDELKKMVRERYSEIALQDKDTNSSSCCGSSCCAPEITSIMADDYSKLEGYNADADLGLGCGIPTKYAGIKKGDTVIDLGSGAGNDCFVARAEAGETGKVLGIDMTPAMIDKARMNAKKLGYDNVEFLLGEIEHLPAGDKIADVVLSNCVLNLVPDKTKAFSEIYRVLKPGGHFTISDIVLNGNIPASISRAAEMYAGCVSGAMQKDAYLDVIRKTGFVNAKVQAEKVITIPDSILENYLNADELKAYKQREAGIFSITVTAEKDKDSCCDKSSCCN